MTGVRASGVRNEPPRASPRVLPVTPVTPTDPTTVLPPPPAPLLVWKYYQRKLDSFSAVDYSITCSLL